MCFSFKLGFTRKVRYIFDGHGTAALVGSTYVIVILSASVIIALEYTVLKKEHVYSITIFT